MSDSIVADAVVALRRGELVVLPTETVYGLAGDLANPDAVAAIYRIKGRPADHPLIVHLPDATYLDRYARDIPAAAYTLAAAFWPGPLTMVLHKSDLVPETVTGGQATVALRVVDHPLTAEILREFGDAVVAPSANRFGRVSPTTAAHVRDDLGDDVAIIVDGGPARIGIESTIVALTGAVPIVLRAGAITPSQVEAVLDTVVAKRNDSGIRAPGMLASHYAPRTPLRLANDDDEAGHLVENSSANGQHAVQLILADDPAVAAQTLYDALRVLDSIGAAIIVAVLPPDTEANAAVRDRLQRAATH